MLNVHPQISASNATHVTLRNVGFNLSGNFTCEVTADESTRFYTSTATNTLTVVGMYCVNVILCEMFIKTLSKALTIIMMNIKKGNHNIFNILRVVLPSHRKPACLSFYRKASKMFYTSIMTTKTKLTKAEFG